MKPGFINGQRYWVSSEGFAIGFSNFENGVWMIGTYHELNNGQLFMHIKDPEKECPHSSLDSKWWYNYKRKDVKDDNDYVSVKCLS